LLDCRAGRGIQFTLRFGKAITIAAMVPGKKPGRGETSVSRFWGIGTAGGDNAPAYGTRASANTSGPNLNWQRAPVKLRTFGSAPMKKISFFCRAGFRKERALSKSAVQPFDLMSRRHPLSSTRAVGLKFASWKQTGLTVLVTSPASIRRQSFKRRAYFFLETFFAVFFTALFAFFAFLAFLAMLPS
jgi:hypothetical protein